MKISAIETFLVHNNWSNFLFVKVHTDEGLHGIGEAYMAGPDEAVVAVIRDFESWLVGRDPCRIERLWALMYNGSRFPIGAVTGAAISGIEHALWDIKGKILGVPVYELLGGKYRDRVRVYHGVYDGDTPEELAEAATRTVERYGCTAIKIAPHPLGYAQMPQLALLRAVARRMEAVREAVGPDVDVAVDLHARMVESGYALQMMEVLKPYRPLFVEELIRPENVDALASLRSKAAVPVATGECLYTKHQFRALLVRDAVDIIQPDVCLTGGLLEMKKIAGMAESFFVPLAPHNPMGPVATAVNVHLAASVPNFMILEYRADDQPPRCDFVVEPIALKEGYLELPPKSGLGVELNEEAFAAYPSRRWHRPFEFGADGGVAFW